MASAPDTDAPPSVRRRSTRVRLAGLGVLVLLAATVMGLLYLVYYTIAAERVEREQVNSTSQILLEIRNVGRNALSAETGQRGYFITLDEAYLEPYRVARERHDASLNQLREAFGEDVNPRQAQLLGDVERLADQKFTELDASVALLENRDLIGARTMILTDEGKDTMNRLRVALRELELMETRILNSAVDQSARAEAMVLPLLGLLLIVLLIALIFAYLLLTRTVRAEAEAAQASALAEARDRADLLAKELNHRVKNLFAVILAIVQMSARGKPEAKEVVGSISDRIRALLTAHEVTQGHSSEPVALLEKLIETTLAPYRSDELVAKLDGPEILIASEQATPLGLVLHEMTTNAVKYGAWANGGTILVNWRRENGDIVIQWREHGARIAEPGERQGFGSMLMTSSARQLRGEVERRFTDEGAAIDIRFPAPVKPSESAENHG
ncbi:sensor histidine kinase [Qipengyuania atrilutea]|uniref:histidine kinase n=1 Tax=Qipengyuania atrilutea TaxID=2744473 RepID=A0A850H4B6_9SPHN|nr:CHASE3 domain-containing protein [Actirhodobacter atriluteus]NVD44713.1 CHASE3 domain-containing protein [Actirhodobacter atriluteus]